MNESYTSKLPLTDSIYETNYSNGVEINHGFTGGGVQGNFTLSHTRQGVSLPGWKEIIARGENATTPFSATQLALTSYQPGLLTYTKRSLSGQLQKVAIQRGCAFMPSGSGIFLGSTTANNQALKYAFQAVKNTRTSFQGGVFIGEAREAIRMIASPAKAFRKGLDEYFGTAVKRARRATRKAKPRILAETYLEYVMGWAPLFSDIASGIKAYKALVDRVTINRVTRQGTEESVDFIVSNGQMYWGYAPLIYDLRRTTTVLVKYYIAMKTVQQGARANAEGAERFGLIATEFVPAVWELIPWSFVVDYFTNIGDILNAVTTSTSDVAWICKVVRAEAIYNWVAKVDDKRLKDDSPNLIVTCTGFPGQWSSSNKTVVRSSVLSLPIPVFTVSVPSSPFQWVNLAALAVSHKKAINAL